MTARGTLATRPGAVAPAKRLAPTKTLTRTGTRA